MKLLKFIFLPMLLAFIMNVIFAFVLSGIFQFELDSFVIRLSNFIQNFIIGAAIYGCCLNFSLNGKLLLSITYALIMATLTIVNGYAVDGHDLIISGYRIPQNFHIIPALINISAVFLGVFGSWQNEKEEINNLA